MKTVSSHRKAKNCASGTIIAAAENSPASGEKTRLIYNTHNFFHLNWYAHRMGEGGIFSERLLLVKRVRNPWRVISWYVARHRTCSLIHSTGSLQQASLSSSPPFLGSDASIHTGCAAAQRNYTITTSLYISKVRTTRDIPEKCRTKRMYIRQLVRPGPYVKRAVRARTYFVHVYQRGENDFPQDIRASLERL